MCCAVVKPLAEWLRLLLDLSMCVTFPTIASMMLDIVSYEGHAMLLQASGRIDFFNADVFEVQVRSAAMGVDRDVVIDASGVTYMSTAGLRVFLRIWQDLKKENRTLHICALRPYIQQVFEIIGFNQIIPNHADVAEALAAVESRA